VIIPIELFCQWVHLGFPVIPEPCHWEKYTIQHFAPVFSKACLLAYLKKLEAKKKPQLLFECNVVTFRNTVRRKASFHAKYPQPLLN
jgi:hypothetical protein